MIDAFFPSKSNGIDTEGMTDMSTAAILKKFAKSVWNAMGHDESGAGGQSANVNGMMEFIKRQLGLDSDANDGIDAVSDNTVTVDKGRIAAVSAKREGGTELYGGTRASRMLCAFINWLGCCMSSAEQDGGGIAAPFHEMFHKMLCMDYGCFCAVNFGSAAIQSGGLSFEVLLHTNISAWASLAEKGIVLIKVAFAKLTANPEQIKEELRKSANMYTNSHEIEDDDVDDDDFEGVFLWTTIISSMMSSAWGAR